MQTKANVIIVICYIIWYNIIVLYEGDIYMNSNLVIEEIINSVPINLMENNDIETLKLRAARLGLIKKTA